MKKCDEISVILKVPGHYCYRAYSCFVRHHTNEHQHELSFSGIERQTLLVPFSPMCAIPLLILLPEPSFIHPCDTHLGNMNISDHQK